jgi:hypothetical protein
MINADLRALRMGFLARGAAFSILSFALPGKRGWFICIVTV